LLDCLWQILYRERHKLILYDVLYSETRVYEIKCCKSKQSLGKIILNDNHLPTKRTIGSHTFSFLPSKSLFFSSQKILSSNIFQTLLFRFHTRFTFWFGISCFNSFTNSIQNSLLFYWDLYNSQEVHLLATWFTNPVRYASWAVTIPRS
jgi:hypothetical protein